MRKVDTDNTVRIDRVPEKAVRGPRAAVIDAVVCIAGDNIRFSCRGAADHVVIGGQMEPYTLRRVADACQGTRAVGADVVAANDVVVAANVHALRAIARNDITVGGNAATDGVAVRCVAHEETKAVVGGCSEAIAVEADPVADDRVVVRVYSLAGNLMNELSWARLDSENKTFLTRSPSRAFDRDLIFLSTEVRAWELTTVFHSNGVTHDLPVLRGVGVAFAGEHLVAVDSDPPRSLSRNCSTELILSYIP